MKFSVPDMSCGHCRAAIETAVRAADPAAEIGFDQDQRQVEIASRLGPGEVIAALDRVGFPATELPA